MGSLRMFLITLTIIGSSFIDGQPMSTGNRVPDKLRELSINILKEISRTSDGNLVYSPLSVETALGMLDLGAMEQTKEELQKVLGTDQPSHNQFQEIIGSVKGDPSLTSSNAAFINKGFSLKPKYKDELQRSYSASEKTVDFQDKEKAIQTVNDWVSRNTQGKIKELLTSDFIQADTKMILANAIYFKGQWKYSFKTDQTRTGMFTTDKGTTVQVPMMSQDEKFRYQYVPQLNSSALEMPYSNDRFSMLIILPHQGDVKQLVRQLTHYDLVDILNTMSDVELVVTMPRFKVGRKASMKEPLQQLGIKKIFLPTGNLRGIAEESLHVSDIVHEAQIEVDEQGTIGSAATGVGVVAISLPPSFTANKPFIFFVMDRQFDIPIFIGQVVDPSLE